MNQVTRRVNGITHRALSGVLGTPFLPALAFPSEGRDRWRAAPEHCAAAPAPRADNTRVTSARIHRAAPSRPSRTAHTLLFFPSCVVTQSSGFTQQRKDTSGDRLRAPVPALPSSTLLFALPKSMQPVSPFLAPSPSLSLAHTCTTKSSETPTTSLRHPAVILGGLYYPPKWESNALNVHLIIALSELMAQRATH